MSATTRSSRRLVKQLDADGPLAVPAIEAIGRALGIALRPKVVTASEPRRRIERLKKHSPSWARSSRSSAQARTSSGAIPRRVT